MAFERTKHVAQQLLGHSVPDSLLTKSPDDVVVTLAIRSPLCKAKKGGLKDTATDEMLAEMFRHTIQRSMVPPEEVGDICVGTVLTPGDAYQVRGAALAAGYPDTVPFQTINRFCSSGLMAVTTIANQIRAGQIKIGLAVGVENMSQNPDAGAPPASQEIMANAQARDAQLPMGWTSENVAGDFNISRQDMDAFAAISYQRAESAQKNGFFNSEIVPFGAYSKNPETGARQRIILTKDDGIRAGTTAEALGKIRSAFPQWPPSATTGGNASQITDGIAAVMLMTRKEAQRLGCDILGKHVTTAVAGLPPRIMGIGPSVAIPMVLERTGLKASDVDLFEINEAFASMYVYCVRKLGLDHEKVNVNGGAIALGHPLGCTGARQVATGLHELRRRNSKILVTSMCIGTGMGAAAVFVGE